MRTLECRTDAEVDVLLTPGQRSVYGLRQQLVGYNTQAHKGTHCVFIKAPQHPHNWNFTLLLPFLHPFELENVQCARLVLKTSNIVVLQGNTVALLRQFWGSKFNCPIQHQCWCCHYLSSSSFSLKAALKTLILSIKGLQSCFRSSSTLCTQRQTGVSE